MVVVTDKIQAGTLLAGRYRIRGRLGRGGTATVFLAEDCVLCRDVAVKRLHTHGSDSDRRRFAREARLGASLMHPNLVTTFDTLSGPDGVLIVMEHVNGRPLSDLIGPTGMDPRRLLEILRPVASALDHAHAHGVVHRDVKPANVLIADDRRVKLVDLGTATAGHLAQITEENEVIGTLAYIAPERLAGDSVGESSADVYSLAVIAFEGLSGRTPYSTDVPGELLHEALHGPAPDITEAWPQATPRLSRVLAQGMDAGPENRQGSAGALIREIEAALPSGARSASVADATEPMTPPISEPVRGPSIGGDQPPSEPIRASSAPRYEEPPAEAPPRSSHGRPVGRIAAAAALAVCLLLGGLATWLALSSGGSGGSGGAHQPTAKHSDNSNSGQGATAPASSTTGAPATAAPSTSSPATTPVSGTSSSGAQLNDEGYSLIQQGRYADAIPVLRRAVASFPSGTTDLTYGYALFNLGQALRLAGQPAAAIPILEKRLQIPDQTATVQRELDAARAAAGQ